MPEKRYEKIVYFSEDTRRALTRLKYETGIEIQELADTILSYALSDNELISRIIAIIKGSR